MASTTQATTDRVIGFQNLGNTCSFNSLFQALYASPIIRRTTTRLFRSRATDGPRKDTPCGAALADLFWVKESLEEGGGGKTTAMHPGPILERMRNVCGIELGVQQDTDDIWHTLIDVLENEEVRSRAAPFQGPRMEGLTENMRACESAWHAKIRSSMQALFHSLQIQQMVCSSCGNESTRFDPFSTLKLCLPEDRATADLQDLIARAATDEPAPEGYHCERCKSGACVRRERIWRPAPFLWISLNRFAQNGRTKLGIPVTFAETVDLRTHLIYEPRNGLMYQLRALVCHSGGLHGGHYYAFAKHGDAWYRLDDDLVEPVSFAALAGSVSAQRVVYMFLYERVRTSS